MEWESDRCFLAASVVMQTLNLSFAAKKDLILLATPLKGQLFQVKATGWTLFLCQFDP